MSVVLYRHVLTASRMILCSWVVEGFRNKHRSARNDGSRAVLPPHREPSLFRLSFRSHYLVTLPLPVTEPLAAPPLPVDDPLAVPLLVDDFFRFSSVVWVSLFTWLRPLAEVESPSTEDSPRIGPVRAEQPPAIRASPSRPADTMLNRLLLILHLL